MNSQFNTIKGSNHKFCWFNLIATFFLLLVQFNVTAQHYERSLEYFSHFNDVYVEGLVGHHEKNGSTKKISINDTWFADPLTSKSIEREVINLLRNAGVPITNTWNDKSTRTLKLRIFILYETVGVYVSGAYKEISFWRLDIEFDMIIPSSAGMLYVQLYNLHVLDGMVNISLNHVVESIEETVKLAVIDQFIKTWKETHR